MKTLINNVNIAYDDHGMGQPIIFLHAFPLNRSMWSGELAALLPENRYRLVALDWPGFGESEIARYRLDNGDVRRYGCRADGYAGDAGCNPLWTLNGRVRGLCFCP